MIQIHENLLSPHILELRKQLAFRLKRPHSIHVAQQLQPLLYIIAAVKADSREYNIVSKRNTHTAVCISQFTIAECLCRRWCGGRNVQINEQINRTKAKSQQIVVQDYSHAYNTLFFI